MLEKFTSDKFPNTHLKFDSEGLKLVVTINIPKDLLRFLPRERTAFKSKHYVYWVTIRIENPNINSIKDAYNLLMQNSMVNIRSAKIEQIKQQQIKIQQSQILF